MATYAIFTDASDVPVWYCIPPEDVPGHPLHTREGRVAAALADLALTPDGHKALETECDALDAKFADVEPLVEAAKGEDAVAFAAAGAEGLIGGVFRLGLALKVGALPADIKAASQIDQERDRAHCARLGCASIRSRHEQAIDAITRGAYTESVIDNAKG